MSRFADFSWGEEPAVAAPATPAATPERRGKPLPPPDLVQDVAAVASVAGWGAGLSKLARMSAPVGVRPERWAQIVRDAQMFTLGWAEEAVDLGWTPAALFGFDPGADHGFHGLVLDIRGSRVVRLLEREAWIPRPPAGAFFHHRHMPDDAPLLWDWRGEK